jgi:hypothetical protein
MDDGPGLQRGGARVRRPPAEFAAVRSRIGAYSTQSGRQVALFRFADGTFYADGRSTNGAIIRRRGSASQVAADIAAFYEANPPAANVARVVTAAQRAAGGTSGWPSPTGTSNPQSSPSETGAGPNGGQTQDPWWKAPADWVEKADLEFARGVPIPTDAKVGREVGDFIARPVLNLAGITAESPFKILRGLWAHGTGWALDLKYPHGAPPEVEAAYDEVTAALELEKVNPHLVPDPVQEWSEVVRAGNPKEWWEIWKA